MKTREVKQKDLNALTESLQKSKSAMVVSFTNLTVTKDQEFRNSLREAGASYEVVKNTLARIAVKGTQFEDASEHFKGVTAIAWTEDDPVVLSKAVSKFMKDNAAVYTFKTGVVDGKLIDLKQLDTIANLPSKEELMSKLLYVLNSGAQRLVTVINAVPRNLAVVIKQIGDAKEGEAPVVEAKAEEPVAAPTPEESAQAAEQAADAPVDAARGDATEESAEVEAAPAESDAPAETAEVEAAPADAPVEAEAATESVESAPEDGGAEAAAEVPEVTGEAGGSDAPVDGEEEK